MKTRVKDEFVPALEIHKQCVHFGIDTKSLLSERCVVNVNYMSDFLNKRNIDKSDIMR